MHTKTTCPYCEKQYCVLLATTNEWKYHCTRCDIRFNADGEIRPVDFYKLEKKENDIRN